ncbi:MAG: hypothetical protein ACK5V3_11710 [Bdellovibrionales bacterium]
MNLKVKYLFVGTAILIGAALPLKSTHALIFSADSIESDIALVIGGLVLISTSNPYGIFAGVMLDNPNTTVANLTAKFSTVYGANEEEAMNLAITVLGAVQRHKAQGKVGDVIVPEEVLSRIAPKFVQSDGFIKFKTDQSFRANTQK